MGWYTHPLRSVASDLVNLRLNGSYFFAGQRFFSAASFWSGGIIFSNFRIVGEIALRIAVEKIALKRNACSSGEPFHFRRVNGSPLIKVGADAFGNFFEIVMVGRSRRHWSMFEKFIEIRLPTAVPAATRNKQECTAERPIETFSIMAQGPDNSAGIATAQTVRKFPVPTKC